MKNFYIYKNIDLWDTSLFYRFSNFFEKRKTLYAAQFVKVLRDTN